jgi:hypothetical protein
VQPSKRKEKPLEIERKTATKFRTEPPREKKEAREKKVIGEEILQDCRGFYLYSIKKDGVDLCATKKIVRTCVPST